MQQWGRFFCDLRMQRTVCLCQKTDAERKDMGALEIALLIAGALVFVLSFLIPVGESEGAEGLEEAVREEVKKRMDAEMDTLRSHVDSVVDEAVEYAQEKTERSLERISNEKIMAVNEYSDTVLEEIHKNHQEVMFLYDMLIDKQKGLKETVSEANQAAKQAREETLEAAREAEEAASKARAAASESEKTAEKPAEPEKSTFQTLRAEEVKPEEPRIRTLNWASMAMADAEAQEQGTGKIVGGAGAPAAGETAEARVSAAGPQPQLHEQILALHEKGLSDVQIAKHLNMGVGEVDLIIGIHGK